MTPLEQLEYINSNPGLLVGNPRPEYIDRNLLLLFQAVVNGCMMVFNHKSASLPYPPELQVSASLTQLFSDWWNGVMASSGYPKYAIQLTFTESGFDVARP